eukprot:maker-scaffold278_size225338-snap-gene-1.24 protein:Tk03817 transcript:maker-scaffold278_size225338-snap-gene-1.24-mRNA-1 annotation:"hypothetical protein EAI_01550"
MLAAHRGPLQLAVTGLLLGYYTLGVIGLPFVAADYRPWVEPWFPSPAVALGVPAACGSLVTGLLGARAYYLVRQDRAQPTGPTKSWTPPHNLDPPFSRGPHARSEMALRANAPNVTH